jgi:hypothetical protein
LLFEHFVYNELSYTKLIEAKSTELMKLFRLICRFARFLPDAKNANPIDKELRHTGYCTGRSRIHQVYHYTACEAKHSFSGVRAGYIVGFFGGGDGRLGGADRKVRVGLFWQRVGLPLFQLEKKIYNQKEHFLEFFGHRRRINAQKSIKQAI